MASQLGVDYVNAPINGVTMYDPCKVYVGDNREAKDCDPFVTVEFTDENKSVVKAYLPPRLAVELHELLSEIMSDHDIMAEEVDK